MEIDQQRCPLLDVNDVVDAIKRYAPRRRWFCMNSGWFGPHFSGPALLGYSLTDLERVLEKPQFSWLNWVDNSRSTGFLWRPIRRRAMQDKAIVESTKNGVPVWLYFDSNGPPSCQPEDQLDAVRVGWANLNDDLRDAITATVLAGAFGPNAPVGGWEGIETPQIAVSRTRRDGRRESAPNPKRVRVRLPSVAVAPRRASAPAAIARPLDGDCDAVEPSPAPPQSLAEKLRAIGNVVADRGLAERDECIRAFFDGCVSGRHSDRRRQMREIVGVLTSEDDAVDFHDDLTAVKRGLQGRHDGYALKNDRKGIGAYVQNDGTLVPWDYKKDLLLKRKAAPRWMSTLREMLRVKRWHQDQDRANRSRKHKHTFFDYHTKEKLPWDSAELAAFIESREAGLELGPDEGDAVAKEILRQCRLREEFVKTDAGAVDDAKPEAAASAESVARTRAVDEKAGGKNGRWVYVEWGKSDEPGYCMNMFSPETYSVKQKRKKKGLQHWRAFREREEEEG